MTTAGILYVVATPIGNLDDISSRGRATLASVAMVAAEDTRRTRQLLDSLGIRARLVSFHEHNESERVPELLEQIAAGWSVALVSDAGTPLVSDPGYRLVAEARRRGIAVTPVPGCCAAVAALSVAGLPSDRFHFEGFLPARSRARAARLGELARLTTTLIFYEAVHRIDATLADMIAAFGAERRIVVGREITKLHETFYNGTLAEVRDAVARDPGGRKGELTLVVAGSGARPAVHGELDRVVAILCEQLPAAQAAGLAARLTGASRREAYAAALRVAGEGTPESD